ncbi:UDP-glucose 4-epimerase [Pacificibacter maritimus]|uniref:UDP-glucose 4-epimerase n=1 Tax=Pacificibacter maritimus TaxID=762213 RepID=A0A3N4U9G1_9RHOB|nr:NAD-dependent epimerase/dehydratase family protein [Pacificibacter maritimus]RPE66428.1 UDP-glucose 4-epimerase [Pacificibacter maritimus]
MSTASNLPCLVIGASGFIGRNLVETLTQQGIAVRAMTRSGEPFLDHPLVEFVKGDMSDINSYVDHLQGIGSCVQLCTTTKPGSANKDISFDITSNLIANVQLLEKLSDLGNIKFVFISSGGTVYGDPAYVPIDEKHPTEPKSSYGITKLAIEKYISMFVGQKKLDATILRVSNPFGKFQPYNDGQGVIATFLWRIMNDEPIEIWGDGTAVRDYLHVDDVCASIIHALQYRGDQTVFNIGQGQGLSLTQIIEGIEKTLGKSAKVSYRPGRATDVRTNVLDCTLAHQEMNWAPQTEFHEGLENTAAWMAELK